MERVPQIGVPRHAVAVAADRHDVTYAGATEERAGDDLDRTREGFFEVIEMATYASSAPGCCSSLKVASVSASFTVRIMGDL